MKLLRLVPKETNISFMRIHILALSISSLLVLLSLVGFFFIGLNTGIDFKGGTNIEVRVNNNGVNISYLRDLFRNTNIGEVNIQEFGKPQDYIISVQKQSQEKELEQNVVIIVKDILKNEFFNDVEFRRTETVGPVISSQLKKDGAIALGAALIAMLIYIWFRFEWQFSIAAIVALIHDVVTTVGLFSVFDLEFNLAIVAAILTTAGYSINDTVVVFDRVRENLRKYKSQDHNYIYNKSINETLSRTLITSMTTLIALIIIYFFGGAVLSDFALAMIWGVVIGTYSSIFIAVSFLTYFNIYKGDKKDSSEPVPEYER